jgi:hypothetical protein
MKNLQQLREIERERLDTEEIVTLVEVLETGRSLRRAFGGTLGACFLLLGLHARHVIELPPVAINTVSYSIPLAVVGLFAKYVSNLWSRRPRGRAGRDSK